MEEHTSPVPSGELDRLEMFWLVDMEIAKLMQPDCWACVKRELAFVTNRIIDTLRGEKQKDKLETMEKAKGLQIHISLRFFKDILDLPIDEDEED